MRTWLAMLALVVGCGDSAAPAGSGPVVSEPAQTGVELVPSAENGADPVGTSDEPEATGDAPVAAPDPTAPQTMFWHGSADIAGDAHFDRGKPRYHIVAGDCLEDGACVTADGFPAIRVDGAELLIAIEQGFEYDYGMAERGKTKELAALELLPALHPRHVLPLVDREAALAHTRAGEECCAQFDDDEEGCEPAACSPSDATVRRISVEVRRELGNDVAAANAYIRKNRYRTLVAIPGASEDAQGVTLRVSVAEAPAAEPETEAEPEDEAETEVVVRVVDVSSNAPRFESRFTTLIEDFTPEVHAWRDAVSGLVLVEVALPTDGESDYDGVEMHYLVGTLSS